MPRVDANTEEGAVGRWLVACGERVRAGQPLVEVITDKAAFELEAEQDGVLRSQVAAEKSVVPVGYVIALIGADADEPLPDVADENEALVETYGRSLVGGVAQEYARGQAAPVRAPSTPNTASAPAARAQDAGPARPEGVPPATPAARRLAADEGISLEDMARRVRGVVRRSDVEDELKRRKQEAGQ